MNKKEFILYQSWGGLGDNLQFSTLPDLCNENNFRFSISEYNVYRNEEIRKLVWEQNPFVKNIESELQYNWGQFAPDTDGYAHYDTNRHRPNTRNTIEWNEARMGFAPKNSVPKIYYEPQIIDDLKDYLIVDMGAATISKRKLHDLSNLLERLKKILSNEKKVFFLESPYIVSPFKIESYNKLKVKDIFHYCDIIKSCKEFVCLYSGSSVLSSAIREQGITCLFTVGENYKKDINNGMSYLFPNVKYILPDNTILNEMDIWRF